MTLQRHLYIIILITVLGLTKSAVRFTNLKCKELDPSFATIEKCQLKVLKRGVIGMNIYVALHQIPVTNVSVNLSMFKKASGYRPFLYNITVNFCDFLKNRKKYPFLKIVVDALLQYSNVNHPCPFDHDIVISNWTLKEEMFRFLPLPEGEYLFQIAVGAYNDWKADFKGYVEKKD